MMKTKMTKMLVLSYFSHVYGSMPLNVFVFFPAINFKRNYSLSEISTFLSVVYLLSKNAVRCSQPLFINLQYSSEVDGQRTRKTFARFSCSAQKKGRAKACVLREIFAAVIQRSQIVLFRIVSEN